MTAGIGLFGTFTAYLASFFLSPREDSDREAEVADELRRIRERLDRLEGAERTEASGEG